MSEKIMVVKESGKKEHFDPYKVKRALRRSGLNGKEAEEVLELFYPHLHDGMSTKKIYQKVFQIVRNLRPEIKHKYNLKRALKRLGPAGYIFEDFIAKLYGCMGYDTRLRMRPKGKCVSHEIDVVASKGKEKLMIECKFHSEPGMKCRIQTALYVYARFLDLAAIDEENRFTKPHLVTNTKFSTQAVKYSRCMGMPLLGWKYPLRGSLEYLIDREKCYPVSVINMKKQTLDRLFKKNMITIPDIPGKPDELMKQTGISKSTAKRIVKEASYAR